MFPRRPPPRGCCPLSCPGWRIRSPALGKQHLPPRSSAVPELLLWPSLELISLWYIDLKAPQGGGQSFCSRWRVRKPLSDTGVWSTDTRSSSAPHLPQPQVQPGACLSTSLGLHWQRFLPKKKGKRGASCITPSILLHHTDPWGPTSVLSLGSWCVGGC